MAASLFNFEFIGTMPLILHHDNIEGADEVSLWITSDEGQKISKAGDDRHPAWKWQTCLYTDVEITKVVLPVDMIMSALLFAGERVPIVEGRRKKCKELSQVGLMVHGEHFPLMVGGKPVLMKPIQAMRDKPFAEQARRVQGLGFSLFVKKVSMQNRDKITKHVRVRPRFEEWSLNVSIEIIDPILTPKLLKTILDYMGKYVGFGDWRPGVKWPKRPGPFGRFEVKLKHV